MINDLLFRIKMKKLRWKLFWIDYKAEKAVKKGRKKGLKAEALDNLRQEFSPDYFDTLDDIEKLKTKHILLKADIESIPIPPVTDKDAWKKSIYNDQDVLTEKGFNEIRKCVRAELKDRHSVILPWATLLLSSIAAIASLWNAFSK